ncbi:hypothetical protein [Arenicella xantha]|uniref:Uncharacterized protein n=1 Tax=Arenicella xantha TaxID=644221 RepID=A0A395JHN2_9GAMM|nr:hypothetical protein [Arenicella xantha]RBP47025.1 hypothetical protein DFR28_1129 [Arenicella xantha]
MTNSVVKEAIAQALSELIKDQDILITSSIENVALEKIFSAVEEVSPNMLSARELGGIVNALNTHDLGFGLDENDFQTIIGLSKEELKIASRKLKVKEW